MAKLTPTQRALLHRLTAGETVEVYVHRVAPTLTMTAISSQWPPVRAATLEAVVRRGYAQLAQATSGTWRLRITDAGRAAVGDADG